MNLVGMNNNTGFWQMLLSQARLMLVVFDEKGKEIFVSESAEKLLGYKASEVIEKSVTNILCAGNRDCFRKSLNAMIRHMQAPMYVELLMKHRTGKQLIMGGHLLLTKEFDTRGNVCLFVRDISHEKQMENKVNYFSDTYKNLNEYKVEAREKERQNIASAIHDDIGQLLAALKLELGMMNADPDNASNSQRRIHNMIKTIDEAALKTRKLCYELRPLMPDNFDPTTAIRKYCIEWSERTGIKVNLSIDSVILNNKISLALFRIVQEALTNVTRHANATSVTIDLHHTKDALNLVIHDNGVGIAEYEASQLETYGIAGMRERAELCNGFLTISGKKGTRIELNVPFVD